MQESAPKPDPFDAMTDEMLVRMVVLILKDVSKLAPFLARISEIAANADHPAFASANVSPEIAAIAKRQRVQQMEAFAGLLNMLIMNHSAGMRLIGTIERTTKAAAVASAMEKLGLSDNDNGQSKGQVS